MLIDDLEVDFASASGAGETCSRSAAARGSFSSRSRAFARTRPGGRSLARACWRKRGSAASTCAKAARSLCPTRRDLRRVLLVQGAGPRARHPRRARARWRRVTRPDGTSSPSSTTHQPARPGSSDSARPARSARRRARAPSTRASTRPWTWRTSCRPGAHHRVARRAHRHPGRRGPARAPGSTGPARRGMGTRRRSALAVRRLLDRRGGQALTREPARPSAWSRPKA